MTIHILHKQGQSIKAITRELGCSRNTVKKYLNPSNDEPRYQRTVARASKLDPFKDYLHMRIGAAHPDWIPAAVLYEEIRARGYTGKIRILSDYLAKQKPQRVEEPLVRFETPPGKQLQVDFTTIRRGRDALKAFVATLGYSRASYVRFYDHERTCAWIEGLQHAFDFFGGVTQQVLFDNPKTVMIERDAYGAGQHRWNVQLLALAQDYGFQPRACRPYRAKTKGKVERFNHYLKTSFVVPLQASCKTAGLSLDVHTANGYIGAWLTTRANARVHATTQAIPNERLIQERDVLRPLPIHNGNGVMTPPVTAHQVVAIPYESLQHPLSVYDQFTGGGL